jgi:hypothetical protein
MGTKECGAGEAGWIDSSVPILLSMVWTPSVSFVSFFVRGLSGQA